MTSSTLTERSAAWDYAESVARVSPMVAKWGALTVELLHELCQARAALSSPGARSDLGANASRLKTWGRYCLDVGLTRSTVNRWLLRYDDDTRTVKELPEPEPVREPDRNQVEPEAAQESVVDAEPPEVPATKAGRTKLEPERQAKVDEFKARIAREEQTTPEPSGDVGDLLRRIDDQILRMQEAARRFSHLALSGGSDNEVQNGMLDLLQRYVQSFEAPERQVEVAHNLIKALRLIIHEVNGEEASA